MSLYLYRSLSFLIKHDMSSLVQRAESGVYGMNVRPLDNMFSSSTESWYEERLTTLSKQVTLHGICLAARHEYRFCLNLCLLFLLFCFGEKLVYALFLGL